MEQAITFWMNVNKTGNNQKRAPADRRRAGAALREAYFSAKRRNLIATQDELADELNFNRSNISQYFSGQRSIPYTKIHRLAELLQCNPYEIADDSVRVQLNEETERKVKEGIVDEYFIVEEAGANNGGRIGVSNYGNFTNPFKLRTDWIEAEGIDPTHLKMVKIAAKKTNSDISHSETVFVRTDRVETLVSGGVYAIALEGMNVLKRITTQKRGVVLESVSDDDRSPPRFMTPAELKAERIGILGLVWWSFGRLY